MPETTCSLAAVRGPQLSYPKVAAAFHASCVATFLFVAAICHPAHCCAQPPPTRQTPHRYILDFPTASQFSPPVQNLFAEAAGRQTRRTGVQQHPNGGFGLAMIKQGNISLRHTGADYAWFAVGDPVFAAADGIVRYSEDGVRQQIKEKKLDVRLPASAMDYGSMIIIEHRLPEGEPIITLYAHLDNERLVHTGDIVMAGQMIGRIGRKSALVNGGYEPHLHFGIRNSLIGKSGMPLMQIALEGKPALIRVKEVGETTTSLLVPPGTPPAFTTVQEGVQTPIVRQDGEYRMPSWPMWRVAVAFADIAGYAPTLDGWKDPTFYLRDKRADSFPARHFTPTYRRGENWIANTTGQKAQPWEVTKWLNPPGLDANDLEDMQGKIVCLVFVQATCETSQLICGAPLKQLHDRFPDGDDVRMVILQTPFRKNPRASVRTLERMTKGLPSNIAVGHCEPVDGKPAEVVERYGVEATPWTVIIGHDGTIEHSSCVIRPEDAIRIVDRLRKARVAASAQPIDGATTP